MQNFLKVEMRITDKLNMWIHPWMIKYAVYGNRKVIAEFEKLHPELYSRVDRDAGQRYMALWFKLRILFPL